MLSYDFVKVFIYLEFLLEFLYTSVNSSDVGLPLIQFGHDDSDTDFPDMLEQVHLTDFFWTGSGDGPPDFLKKIHTGISRGKDVVVKTETVVATIYVDGNNEIDIPLCLDCLDDAGHPIDNDWNLAIGTFTPQNFTTTDRRYWLLTVLSGFYTQQDNPLLAAKLAKLYRLAFTRQQTKHLGINGDQHPLDNTLITNPKDRRHQLKESTTITTITSDSFVDEIEVFDTATNLMPSIKEFPQKRDFDTEWFSSSEELPLENISDYYSNKEEIENITTSVYSTTTSELWEFIQQPLKSGKQKELPTNALMLIDDHVHVIIHNITQLTEKDLEQNIASNDDTYHRVNSTNKIDERPIANQTELIYSVFVNGRPILATTAANDMKLVSESEVSRIIGKQIYMKAEPYIREPQATPLAPAIHHSSATFFSSLQNNPALIVISFIVALLLLLLCGALGMLVRSHICNSKLPGQRTSSHSELFCEAPSGTADSNATVMESGHNTRNTQSRDVGTQNFSYENESGRSTREPRIHFPRPPANKSSRRRDSVTSSDNTSDSSVYCPVNSINVDVQRMLNEKADNLFERPKARSRHQYDQAEGLEEEATYSRIISEKKRNEKSRQKSKRKYLSENRVGSLETSPIQSQKSEWSGGEQSKLMRQQRIYENYDGPVETFNNYNNYNRNKILHQRTIFNDKIFLESQDINSARAIQSTLTQSNNDKSSDNSSIGSFLSMQSIRAFPKQELPQPLSRVLDPVSVTYYDNIENATKVGTKTSEITSNEMLVEYFPTPKKPQKHYKHFNSQSDNPDPGVLGPIVWERHKKRFNTDNILDNDGLMPSAINKSTRDPSTMRHHYEDLLEDAIQKYENQEDDLPMPLSHNDCLNTRKPLKIELRGSSAEKVNTPSKNLDYGKRPATAHACKAPKSNHSTQPPSPTFGAWNSGSACGSHSRPMSAEPFNRPTDLYPNLISRPTVDLTSAPLIEAIQMELRKFQKRTK